MATKIDLLFSDSEFGTHEYGFISRTVDDRYSDELLAESDDSKYARYVRTVTKDSKWVVHNGQLYKREG